MLSLGIIFIFLAQVACYEPKHFKNHSFKCLILRLNFIIDSRLLETIIHASIVGIFKKL